MQKSKEPNHIPISTCVAINGFLTKPSCFKAINPLIESVLQGKTLHAVYKTEMPLLQYQEIENKSEHPSATFEKYIRWHFL